MNLEKIADIIKEVASANPSKDKVTYLKRAFASHLHGNVFNDNVLHGVNLILRDQQSNIRIIDNDYNTFLIVIGNDEPSNQETELFCYRCTKTIKPYYKHTTSTFHYDVNNTPIRDLLPHCPICDHEVVDWSYHKHIIESKKRLYRERSKLHWGTSE
jgi:hypothetical protein